MGGFADHPTIPGRKWMKQRSASVMLMAHLLELKRLIDPASSSVAQQENLEKTKVMLEQAKASVAGANAVTEMAEHSKPILAKLESVSQSVEAMDQRLRTMDQR